MKTILISICLFLATAVSAQKHTYEVIRQDEFGLLKCSYIEGTNGNTGAVSYSAVILFRDMGYYVDTVQISLPTYAIREQFKTDLKFCIDYLVLKQKDKSQLVKTCNYYSLVIHDFPNRIYMYSPTMGYTVMTIKEATRLFQWMESLTLQ